MDERTDRRRRDPPQKSSSGLRQEELMIREKYTKVSYIPSAYSYQGSSMRMVLICGPMHIGMFPVVAICEGSSMRLYFIDSKYFMQLKEDDAEVDLGLAQLLQQRKRRRRALRPWNLRRGGVSLGKSDASPSFLGGILVLKCGQN